MNSFTSIAAAVAAAAANTNASAGIAAAFTSKSNSNKNNNFAPTSPSTSSTSSSSLFANPNLFTSNIASNGKRTCTHKNINYTTNLEDTNQFNEASVVNVDHSNVVNTSSSLFHDPSTNSSCATATNNLDINNPSKNISNKNSNSHQHQHQIGTNLSELSVCWHKMSSDDTCDKCGEPFYEANQFNCQKCSSDSIEQLNKTLDNDLNLNDKIKPVNDLITNNETLNSNFNTESTFNFNSDTVQTILTDAELTRHSFEQEFSSLIVKSTISETSLSPLFKGKLAINLADKIDIISSSSGSTISTFSSKDLIEQIKLYNKYNSIKFNDIKYELDERNDLKINGVLKIHWNLKSALKINSNQHTSLRSHSHKDNHQTNFTSLKHLNEKKQQQTSWDDSSIPLLNNSLINVANSPNSTFLRSQTVKCRPAKSSKRTNIIYHQNNDKSAGGEDNSDESNNQMFIPSFGSVSSICIDNTTTCLNAIKILLEKFHIANPPENYALYKVYQTGDKKELKEDDFPLIHRLWMGPFVEDKIFIMEKGRQLNMSQEITNLICLPQALLLNLIENINQEAIREENLIRNKFANYSSVLKERLENF